jgi:hypothetical protein
VTDWLARKVGGVIDFRLPGDPLELSADVDRARTLEYLAQERARTPGWGIQTKRQEGPEPGRKTSKNAPKRSKTADEPPPSQPGWWNEI